MKTSNIILIGFMSLVVLLLLSLLIQFEKEEKPRFERIDIDIPPHKHLVVVNSRGNINFDKVYKNSAILLYHKEDQIVVPEFELKGDTLIFMSPNKGSIGNISMSGSDLKTITVRNSHLRIDNIATDSLKLVAINGSFHVNTKDSLDFIFMELKQKSKATFNGSLVKDFEINLFDSNAELWIEQIDELRANLYNSSQLSTKKVVSTKVSSDSSSRYYSK
jgi:hypothetical protein